MKRLLLPLLAALALPTAVNAEEFTEIKPQNIYSYKKSSMVKYTQEGRRLIKFLGTTEYAHCFYGHDDCLFRYTRPMYKKYGDKSIQNLIFNYELDCDEQTFNKEGDRVPWSDLYIDQTAVGVFRKYCPIEEWNKLPNK